MKIIKKNKTTTIYKPTKTENIKCKTKYGFTIKQIKRTKVK